MAMAVAILSATTTITTTFTITTPPTITTTTTIATTTTIDQPEKRRKNSKKFQWPPNSLPKAEQTGCSSSQS
jgi:hypothetical protein